MKYYTEKPIEVEILECIMKDLSIEKNKITKEDYFKLKKYLSEKKPTEIKEEVYKSKRLDVSKGTIRKLKNFLCNTTLVRDNLILPYIYEADGMLVLEKLRDEFKIFNFKKPPYIGFLFVLEYLGMGEIVKDDENREIIGFKGYKDKIEEFYGKDTIDRLMKKEREQLKKERSEFGKLIYYPITI
jgi:hypothetical protein